MCFLNYQPSNAVTKMHLKRKVSLILSIMLASAYLYACSGPKNRDATGTYRGVFESKGGQLAFPITITKNQNGQYQGYIVNGADTVRFTRVVQKGDSLDMGFNYYDSHIQAVVEPNGDLKGKWHKRSVGNAEVEMTFKAVKGAGQRYPLSTSDTHVFDGQWPTTFTTDDGHSYPATGQFYIVDHKLYGTFMTETGDYRFLQGTYTDSTVTMSTFDGAHAYLFKGRLQKDGTLNGDFWAYNSGHENWKAHKGKNQLRDPFDIVKIDPKHPRIKFGIKDLDGNLVTNDDPKFKGKPILLYIFGSWCPNCSDEAHMLRKMYDQYKSTGIQFIGVAYEYSENYKTDVNMVERYKKRFDIPWTLLVAGHTGADVIKKTLPFVTDFESYPTTYFADRDHNIKFIHVGFYGPGTGSYYFKEKQAFQEKIDDLTK